MADDTAALQGVLTWLQGHGGVESGTVYFPAGTYKITDTLKVTDVNGVSTRNATTGAMQVFVDGVMNNRKKGPKGVSKADGDMRIGGILSGGGFLNGVVDQVQIYDYVLSPGEVGYIYSHGRMLISAGK